MRIRNGYRHGQGIRGCRGGQAQGPHYPAPPPPVPTDSLRCLCWLGFMLLLCILASCGSGQAQPDPRLKAFHILSVRIVIQDNQAEVDGTIQNSGHDAFPYDVTIDATFYDSSGNVIGQAQGVAEDVFPGTIGTFVLVGQVDSVRYSHMRLTPVSLQERRVEYFTPTPPVSP
jgi:hypothetical protein